MHLCLYMVGGTQTIGRHIKSKNSAASICGVNMLWNGGGKCRGSGFKNVGSWVLKVQQTEVRGTGFRVSSPEFLFNIHKSLYFWKVTTLESVLISYFCTVYNIMIFHGHPTTPHHTYPKVWTPHDWQLWCHSGKGRLFCFLLCTSTGSFLIEMKPKSISQFFKLLFF